MCALPIRSEEHTSELQSPCNLVCRLLLEKKKRLYRGSSDDPGCPHVGCGLQAIPRGRLRSEERRVGKECRSRWAPFHLKKKEMKVDLMNSPPDHQTRIDPVTIGRRRPPDASQCTGPRPFCEVLQVFFFSSRRRHTRLQGDWSSDVCSSDHRCFSRSPLLGFSKLLHADIVLA